MGIFILRGCGQMVFRALSRLVLRMVPRRQRSAIPSQRGSDPQISLTGKLSKNLRENESLIRDTFGNSSDLVIRKLRFGSGPGIAMLVVHIDGLVDSALISDAVIRPIAVTPEFFEMDKQSSARVRDRIRDGLISVSDISEVSDKSDFLTAIAEGKCGIIIDGSPDAFVCDIGGFEMRNLEEPMNEVAIRGPREGFCEVLRVNTSLLRRRIRSPRLWIEEFAVGRISRTQVEIVYLKGIADEKLVQEARERIRRIDIDSIQESGQLEEYIEDAPYSPFPTILRTERPDRVVGGLLEGRIAILTDGTPFALIVPVTITMFLTSPDDYFERSFIASAERLIRHTSFFVGLFLPSLYVAVTTFHYEMLPTTLVIAIAAQHEGIPFPAVFEAFLMEVSFEILREAAVRLPNVFGPAISVVGVLILGEAAVRAGLVSPIMIIILALTAIASFVTPIFSLSVAVRLLRFPMIFLAGSLGLFGVVFGFSIMAIHLASLRSFGIPYLAPIAPIVSSDQKDVFVRLPWWKLDTRPEFTGKRDVRRQARGLKPHPPEPRRKQAPSSQRKKRSR